MSIYTDRGYQGSFRLLQKSRLRAKNIGTTLISEKLKTKSEKRWKYLIIDYCSIQ